MTTYGMIINVDRCTGCHNCFLACRDEHSGNDHLPVAAAQPESGHRWIDVQENERGQFPRVKVDYLPLLCQQCKEPVCLDAGRDGAIYRRPDGVVIIAPENAGGQKGLVSACPHRAIHWNEDRNIAQKCTFCVHLLDQGWKQPRCVEACPTQAIVFGDWDDPDSEINRMYKAADLEELHPEYGLKPSVLYIGLPKRFVVGEVAFSDKNDMAASHVSVSLHGGSKPFSVETDAFGDFSFEGLDEGAAYILQVSATGYRPVQMPVPSRNDVDMGTITLVAE